MLVAVDSMQFEVDTFPNTEFKGKGLSDPELRNIPLFALSSTPQDLPSMAAPFADAKETMDQHMQVAGPILGESSNSEMFAPPSFLDPILYI